MRLARAGHQRITADAEIGDLRHRAIFSCDGITRNTAELSETGQLFDDRAFHDRRMAADRLHLRASQADHSAP